MYCFINMNISKKKPWIFDRNKHSDILYNIMILQHYYTIYVFLDFNLHGRSFLAVAYRLHQSNVCTNILLFVYAGQNDL